jgi:hypothetical protein
VSEVGQTALAGHGLLAEGKPFAHQDGTWIRAHGERTGAGLCSCGEASPVLGTDAARRRWHNQHKEWESGAPIGRRDTGG